MGATSSESGTGSPSGTPNRRVTDASLPSSKVSASTGSGRERGDALAAGHLELEIDGGGIPALLCLDE